LTARGVSRSISVQNGMDEGRANLEATQISFNLGSHSGETAEEAAVRQEIATALQSPSVIGKPARSMPPPETALQCLPDWSACPDGWKRNGMLCFADAGYSGPCSSPFDVLSMSVPEKMAYVRHCKVSFPCQGDCDVDATTSCPSMWREVEAGVCHAPSNYVGQCGKVVNVTEFTSHDKKLFGFRCGARWPCRRASPRLYHRVCPEGWTLQFGQSCSAPTVYSGPCPLVVQMRGASVTDKQLFEAACNVSWPSQGDECERDYASSCPFGWLEVGLPGASECRAPLSYTQCSPFKSFDGVGFDEKQDWARVCGQTFPCRSRSTCAKDWEAACPAGWFAFNGGLSCLAPRSYMGACLSVLTGLGSLPASEKNRLQHVCGFSWPCVGEVGPSGVDGPPPQVVAPRGHADLAQYISANGAISPQGTVN